MAQCLFCSIIEGKIPSKKLYEDDQAYAFEDIKPEAPAHFLVVPKQHIETLNDLTEKDTGLVGKLFLVAKQLATEKGVAESGYRAVFNCHRDAGQTVFHIHLHVLGGRPMSWPPG